MKVKLLIVLLAICIAAVAQNYPDGNIKPASSDVSPYNGMGRVALEKRLSDNKSQPVLIQNDFSQRNTVYIVKYDFVLGENITMPEGCVLEFQGGSISGRKTITGRNSGISAGLLRIFDKDVTLAGSWNVLEVYPEWFGVADDGETDDGIAISKAISMGKTVVLSNHYYVKSTITIESPIDIIGRNHGVVVYNGDSNCFVINGPRIRLADFDILGATDESHIRNKTCGFYIGLEKSPSAREIRLDNLNIRYFDVGVLTHNTWIDTFTNVSTRYNIVGVKVEGVSNHVVFNSCNIDANIEKGILLDTQQGINIVFDNCCIEGNHENIRDTNNSIYEKVTFRSCYFEDVPPYNELNFFELNGNGSISILDCSTAAQYNNFFGKYVVTIIRSLSARNRSERSNPISFANGEEIACYSHPIYYGDVVSFSKTVSENNTFHSYNYPQIASKTNLAKYINGGEIGVYYNPTCGIDLYKWFVVDFEIANEVTEEEFSKLFFTCAFYDNDSKTTKYGVARLTTPDVKGRRAMFYKKNMSAKRFQRYVYIPSIIEDSDKDKIGYITIHTNIKMKILNLAFCNNM